MLDEVRAHLRERGDARRSGRSALGTAAGLVDALLERGLGPTRIHTRSRSSSRAPPAMRPGFVARRVETFEELEAAYEVQWQAFEMPEEIAEAELLPSSCARARPSGTRSGWTVRWCAPARPRRPSTACCSTAVRPRASPRPRRVPRPDPGPLGRGGRTGHAGADHPGRLVSRPILERLGFEPSAKSTCCWTSSASRSACGTPHARRVSGSQPLALIA